MRMDPLNLIYVLSDITHLYSFYVLVLMHLFDGFVDALPDWMSVGEFAH